MTRLFLSLILSLSFVAIQAQKIWSPIGEQDLPELIQNNKSISLNSASYYTLDVSAIKSKLSQSQKEGDVVKIKVPNQEGILEAFNVTKVDYMMPKLAAKYSQITSYTGLSVDKKKSVYINVGVDGFHASIKDSERVVYIDPYTDESVNYYAVFDTKAFQKENSQSVDCGYDPSEHLTYDQLPKEINMPTDHTKDPSEPVMLRTYRFALACTGEWGQTQGDVPTAMSRMVTGMTRLNQIAEKELAIRFVLVEDNDALIQLDPNNDPYSSPDGGVILGQNTGVINNIIGSSNYDIGHVWSRCFDTGGVANSSGVCTGIKGNGVTCVTGNNISNIVVNIMAHEVGHQFSAGHSWSNCPSSAQQLAPGTAAEPGSGVTIMSYAGLCGQANNASNSNTDVYHAVSLEQIYFFSRLGAGNNCPEIETTTNNTPEVSVPLGDGVTIPISTPFELTGEAFDPDGDPMLYTWEQVDVLPNTDLGEPIGDAPAFLNVYPSEDKTRLFPRLGSLLGGSSNRTEVLPTYSRNFNFRFVARDQHSSGISGIDWEQITFAATEDAGPFRVVFPNSAELLEIGTTTAVTWDVANTDVAPVSCEFVDIFLSIDGGVTFPYLLAKQSPNNGSADVVIPNLPTNQARIKIKAAENIFFDISNFGNSIVEPTTASFIVETPEVCYELCTPDVIDINLETAGFAGFSDPIDLNIKSGLPQDAVANFSQVQVNPGENSTLSLDLNQVEGSGIFNLVVEGVSGSQTYERTIVLDITGNNFSQLATEGPIANATGIAVAPTFSWTEIEDADAYNIQVATAPTFGSSIVIEIENYVGTSIPSPEILEVSTVYYWRVQGVNTCGLSDFSPVEGFSTEVLSCQELDIVDEDQPVNISASGAPEVDITFPITNTGMVSKVKVTRIAGLHENSGDLEFRVVAPDGTAVQILDNECNNSSNFGIGFDDGSNLTDILCPLTIFNTYKPLEPLSGLNGVDITGFWTFRINDTQPGRGGAVRDLVIEICSNESLAPPVLINNVRLQVPPGRRSKIDTDMLLTTDDNNTPEELIYYVITLPENGVLTSNSNPLQIGDTFLQSDINANRIRYEHDGTATTTDAFRFTVEDGEGGWIGIEDYVIEIDASFTSSVEDTEDLTAINIFPNPTTDLINIEQIDVFDNAFEVKVFNNQGQLISTRTMNGPLNTLNVSGLTTGNYEILLSDGIRELRHSFIKVK